MLRRGTTYSERINDLDLRSRNVDAGSTAGHSGRSKKISGFCGIRRHRRFIFFYIFFSRQRNRTNVSMENDGLYYIVIIFVFARQTMLLQVTQKCTEIE
jgi:hypothetical protein